MAACCPHGGGICGDAYAWHAVADRIAVMEHVQSTKTLFVLKQYKQSGVLTGAARTANSEGRLVVSY